MAGLAIFRCGSHPLLYLRGVVFSGYVHSWAMVLCLPFLSMELAVSFGHREFSTLAFRSVLRHLFSPPDVRWVGVFLRLLLGFFHTLPAEPVV